MNEVRIGELCFDGEFFQVRREYTGYSLFTGCVEMSKTLKTISETLMDLMIEAETLREKMEKMIDNGKGQDQG